MHAVIRCAKREASNEAWRARVADMESFLAEHTRVQNEADGNQGREEALSALLAEAQLTQFESSLRSAGIRAPSDIKHISTEDLAGLSGMNTIQCHRLHRYYQKTLPSDPEMETQAAVPDEFQRQQIFMLENSLTEQTILEHANTVSQVSGTIIMSVSALWSQQLAL